MGAGVSCSCAVRPAFGIQGEAIAVKWNLTRMVQDLNVLPDPGAPAGAVVVKMSASRCTRALYSSDVHGLSISADGLSDLQLRISC